MKKLLYFFFIFSLVLGCSTENNSSDTMNDETGTNEDDTDPQDEITLRLWKEEFEFTDGSYSSIGEYIYDDEGKLDSIVYDNLNFWVFEYDSSGRLVKRRFKSDGVEFTYTYDSNNNIISSTKDDTWWERNAEYDYDSHDRLIEKREYNDYGSLIRTYVFIYQGDEVPVESFGYNADQGNYDYHAIFEWDNKSNPYRVAYTEAYCKSKEYFIHNPVTTYHPDTNFTIYYQITYNEFDLPTEIKFYNEETHDHTFRFQYKELD